MNVVRETVRFLETAGAQEKQGLRLGFLAGRW